MKTTMVLLLENHFNEIYRRVSGYAYRKGHPSPEDVAMSSIAKSLENSHNFQGDLENLISYIISITRYDVIDYYRTSSVKLTADKSIYDIQDSVTPVYYDEYFKYQYLVNIKNMTSSLKTSEAKAIIGKYVYEYSDSEIAELINLTPTSVRVRRSTGISKLKRKLERLNN